jgi:predicted nucleotidyltransferase
MALELEGLLSRKVDLITESSLKPFALESVNKELEVLRNS